jgi:hypothetical protein
MRIWISNTAFFLANLRIAICRLGHPGNFWSCDLQINRYKLADLQVADWLNLILRDEPKNLRTKKNWVPTFAVYIRKNVPSPVYFIVVGSELKDRDDIPLLLEGKK